MHASTSAEFVHSLWLRFVWLVFLGMPSVELGGVAGGVVEERFTRGEQAITPPSLPHSRRCQIGKPRGWSNMQHSLLLLLLPLAPSPCLKEPNPYKSKFSAL